MKCSEQDIAAVVVAWLEALGADVYQEVTVSGGVADIVARVGVEIWIIEVKTSLSIALLVQAMDRRRLAHRVYVAAPISRTIRDFVALARETGIGVLGVVTGNFESTWRYDQPQVREECPSQRWNSRPVRLGADLRPEHKTHAKAGAIGGGGRWTPFRDTCEQLARVVRREPGISLKAAIEEIKHHYTSKAGARSSLAKWIEAGSVEGVMAKRQGVVVTLHPSEMRS